MKKNNNLLAVLEIQELIEKLKEKGYEDFVEAILSNETKVYTKKGRLNKSGACRVLGWKGKQLEDVIQECREILGPEFGLD